MTSKHKFVELFVYFLVYSKVTFLIFQFYKDCINLAFSQSETKFIQV